MNIGFGSSALALPARVICITEPLTATKVATEISVRLVWSTCPSFLFLVMIVVLLPI
jgi:hypothetical protein